MSHPSAAAKQRFSKLKPNPARAGVHRPTIRHPVQSGTDYQGTGETLGVIEVNQNLAGGPNARGCFAICSLVARVNSGRGALLSNEIEKSRLSTSRKYARTPAVVGGLLVGDQVTAVSRGSRSFSNVALVRSAALSPPGKTTWARPKHAAAVNKL